MMHKKTTRTLITGTGICLPEQILTNHDLEKMVDTSDEWIVSRTGIRERRILEEKRSCSDLACEAGRDALERAGFKAQDLDLIIVATVTADYPTPSAACLVQAKLGANKAAAFDLSAGCSGFIYALAAADSFIKSGLYRNALVIGAEVISRFTDWQDRSTCVLFGDGAGAVLLEAAPAGSERGLLDFILGSDGKGAKELYVPGGGSKHPATKENVEAGMHYIKMNGNEIFKFAVRVVEDTLNKLLERHGFMPEELDQLFLHQANERIIRHVQKRLNLPDEKVPINLDRYGNTSAATIPLALHEEVVAGRLKENSLICLVGFGSGLTWGGALIKW